MQQNKLLILNYLASSRINGTFLPSLTQNKTRKKNCQNKQTLF